MTFNGEGTVPPGRRPPLYCICRGWSGELARLMGRVVCPQPGRRSLCIVPVGVGVGSVFSLVFLLSVFSLVFLVNVAPCVFTLYSFPCFYLVYFPLCFYLVHFPLCFYLCIFPCVFT